MIQVKLGNCKGTARNSAPDMIGKRIGVVKKLLHVTNNISVSNQFLTAPKLWHQKLFPRDLMNN